MGGDLHAPKEIWSPAGGFFADPKKWKRNTLVCAAAIVAIAIPVFLKSAELEQRHSAPTRPIPSQRWSKNVPPPQ